MFTSLFAQLEARGQLEGVGLFCKQCETITGLPCSCVPFCFASAFSSVFSPAHRGVSMLLGSSILGFLLSLLFGWFFSFWFYLESCHFLPVFFHLERNSLLPFSSPSPLLTSGPLLPCAGEWPGCKERTDCRARRGCAPASLPPTLNAPRATWPYGTDPVRFH